MTDTLLRPSLPSTPPMKDPPRARRRAVLILVCTAQLMLLVDDTIVNVALPSIGHDLHLSESALSWVANAYFLTFGGVLLVGGRAADVLGRGRVFRSSLGLFTAAAAIRLVPGGADQRRSMPADFAGAALVTGSLLLLVFTIVETNAHGWGSASTLLGVAGAALLAVGFAVRQRTAAQPLIPRALLRKRTVITADLLVLIGAGGLFAMFFFLTLYMQTVRHYAPLGTGLAFLPFSVVIMLTSAVIARVIGQSAPRPLFVLGPVIGAVGMWLLSGIEPTTGYLPGLLPGLVVVASGLGLLFVPLINAATAGVAASDSGIASGLMTTCQQIGGALGIAILVTIASHRTRRSARGRLTPAGTGVRV